MFTVKDVLILSGIAGFITMFIGMYMAGFTAPQAVVTTRNGNEISLKIDETMREKLHKIGVIASFAGLLVLLGDVLVAYFLFPRG